MNKILKIILGLLLVTIPLCLIFPGKALYSWGIAALNLIKGGFTILVILTGIVLIFLGINELKE